MTSIINDSFKSGVFPSSYKSAIVTPLFMNINGTCIKFRPSVRNLGVTLDSTLSLQNVCMVAYFELRRINSIRNLLSIDAVKTLVCSFVLSRLDYCNSLLVGLPLYLI